MTSIVLEFWFPDIFFGYVRQMNGQDIRIFRMETLAGDEVKLKRGVDGEMPRRACIRSD